METSEEIKIGEQEIQVENQENQDEIVSVELPAPTGWKKKFTPKKGGTPRRNEIVFTSPTGEEIKNKRQLDKFLKAHPGGPSSDEFDWGTGDTPRRSARLSGKSKAIGSPDNEPANKRERKSSSKKGAKEKKDGNDGAGDSLEEETTATAADEIKGSLDVEMKEAQDGGDKNAEEFAAGEVMGDEDAVLQDSVGKSEEKTEKVENPEETNNKMDDSDTTDGSIENKSLLPPAVEGNGESKARSPVSVADAGPSTKKEVKAAEEAIEKEAKVGEEASLEKEDSKPEEVHPMSHEDAPEQPKTSALGC